MTNMANSFQMKKTAKISGTKIHCKSEQKTTKAQSTTKIFIRKGEKKLCINFNEDQCLNKGGSKKPSGWHCHSEEIHGNSGKPSADGTWGYENFTRTVGNGAYKTPTPQDTGAMAVGQLRKKGDGPTVSCPLQDGLLSHKQALRGKNGPPGRSEERRVGKECV